MEESVFDRNFDDVYDALLKLPRKIADIRAGAGPYGDLARHVAVSLKRDPICVCVVGEAVFFINDLVRHRAARELSHKLAGYPYPFCIMSLDTFELAVAVAKTEGIALGAVLRDYWSASEIKDMYAPRADDFGGRALRGLESYGRTFIHQNGQKVAEDGGRDN